MSYHYGVPPPYYNKSYNPASPYANGEYVRYADSEHQQTPAKRHARRASYTPSPKQGGRYSPEGAPGPYGTYYSEHATPRKFEYVSTKLPKHSLREKSPFRQNLPYSLPDQPETPQEGSSRHETRTSISPKDVLLDGYSYDDDDPYLGPPQLPFKTGVTRPSNAPPSSGRRKVLPMNFETQSAGKVNTQSFDTIPDTGSDENAMDWKTCKTLGINLIRGRQSRKEFFLANGKTFRSMGQAEVVCSFVHEKIVVKYKIRFNVFSRLAEPIIMGREFLDQTQTLTQHRDRLRFKSDADESMPRVMHFNRPGSRMQCSVDGKQIFANADTGAEMNLVSPSFIAKSGRRRKKLTQESLSIMLADGSTERITASFEGNFSLDGSEGTTNVEAKFYVLPGLTSEALVGEDTLDHADVFWKHLDAFVDLFEDDEQLGLNIIKWLTEKESRLMNVLQKRALPRSDVNAAQGIPDPTLSPSVFRAALTEADARELHHREQAEKRIAGLSGSDRTAALQAEESRATTYENKRDRCLALHHQRLST